MASWQVFSSTFICASRSSMRRSIGSDRVFVRVLLAVLVQVEVFAARRLERASALPGRSTCACGLVVLLLLLIAVRRRIRRRASARRERATAMTANNFISTPSSNRAMNPPPAAKLHRQRVRSRRLHVASRPRRRPTRSSLIVHDHRPTLRPRRGTSAARRPSAPPAR